MAVRQLPARSLPEWTRRRRQLDVHELGLAADSERLDAQGLELTPWLSASEGAWAYAWEGGDLTESALAGASADPLCEARPGALVAADLTGSFPGAMVDEEGALKLMPRAGDAAGRLCLFGSSAPFRAAHLHAESSDNAQLLLLATPLH